MWRRKKRPATVSNSDVSLRVSSLPLESQGGSVEAIAQVDATTDLMRRIQWAIDSWSKDHGLHNLPPEIILQQVQVAIELMRESLGGNSSSYGKK